MTLETTADTARGQWRTWSRLVAADDVEFVQPRDTAHVAQILTAAAESGRRVRPIGSGHSFSPIAQPVDVALDLRRCDGIRSVDIAAANGSGGDRRPGGARVRVGAGIRLRALNSVLDALGLAMPNLGDIDTQTLAGALATGTHGTGGRLFGLASAVVGLTLVTLDGTVHDLRPGDPLFDVARINLGALGIVTEVEVECVPAFRLEAIEEPMPLADVLFDVSGFIDSAQHAEFFWFPHTDIASTRRNRRVPDGQGRPLPRVRGFVEDRLVSNGVYELVNRVGHARPGWAPALNRLSAASLGRRTYADASHRVFCSDRCVRFVETEYAVPRVAVGDVLAQLRRCFARDRTAVTFPLEVRFLAADDVWLSGAYGRDTAYIACHQYWRSPHAELFEAFERIVAEHDGRPHWGKMHSLGRDALLAVHPHLDELIAARDRLDPRRLLTNPYLDRVLGP